MKIAARIQNLHSAVEKTAASFTQILPGICTPDEAEYVDSNCNWSKAKTGLSGGAEVLTYRSQTSEARAANLLHNV